MLSQPKKPRKPQFNIFPDSAIYLFNCSVNMTAMCTSGLLYLVNPVRNWGINEESKATGDASCEDKKGLVPGPWILPHHYDDLHNTDICPAIIKIIKFFG
jgi:hypothetical protein